MGSVTTPTYRLEMRVPGWHLTPSAWHVRGYGCVKGDGKPTDANLAAYVAAFEASTREGGANAHLGAATVTSARIIRQATGEVVASYAAPMFQAVGVA